MIVPGWIKVPPIGVGALAHRTEPRRAPYAELQQTEDDEKRDDGYASDHEPRHESGRDDSDPGTIADKMERCRFLCR